MDKGIGHDLFARVMRMPSRDRSDILEFLGQSPVDLTRAVSNDAICAENAAAPETEAVATSRVWMAATGNPLS